MKRLKFLTFIALMIWAGVTESCEKDETKKDPLKKDPVITWATPADIFYGTLLSTTQLNATADVPGTFVYTPAIGAKLELGANQDLEVAFTPTDTANYNTATKTVKINVINTFTDSRDGNVYHTVTIGNQVWMAENLRYLPAVAAPDTGSTSTPFYYVYGHAGRPNVHDAKATANYTTYGVLYNWPAAMNGAASSTLIPSGVQGVCPTGWHLPSDAEWTYLIGYIGGESVAGDKLKESGATHWYSPNTGATNETGFTALPGGNRNKYGAFKDIRYIGFWWSATEDGTGHAWEWSMGYNYRNINRYNAGKESGYSVRCVRD